MCDLIGLSFASFIFSLFGPRMSTAIVNGASTHPMHPFLSAPSGNKQQKPNTPPQQKTALQQPQSAQPPNNNPTKKAMDTASAKAGVATAKASSSVSNKAVVVANTNNNSDNNDPNTADSSSSATSAAEMTSTTARDNIYCLELAQRSVARAALHLGITSMTQDTLQVLGDVLCQYLERLSAVLAQGVESSGRSTQHVHALDMLQAVELCTSPAVSRVHFTNNNGGGAETTGRAGAKSGDSSAAVVTTSQEDAMMEDKQNDKDSSSQHQQQHPPGSWQGLAAFCFGPTWQEEPSTKETQEEEAQLLQLQQTGGAGGKVGPSALATTEAKSAMQEESAKDVQEGWRAPFPDEVVPFPLTAAYASHHTGSGGAVDVMGSSSSSVSRVSNPHPMTHAQVLMALYGNASKTAVFPSKASSGSTSLAKDANKKSTTPSTKPTPIADIVKGKDLISSEDAEKERKQKEDALKDVPESVWGGMTPTAKDKDATTTTDDQTMADAEGATKPDGDKMDTSTTDGDKKDADTTTSAGNKRKLDETESTPGTPGKDAKDTDAKKDSVSPAVAGSKPEAMETDDATKSSAVATTKDGDAKDDAKPAKKKVKLEDGTAKSTKTATPAKKKKTKDTAAEKAAKEAAEKKEAEAKAAHQASMKAAAAAAEAAKAAAIAAAGGRTYDYVPTFYPPIPNMMGPSSAAVAHAELAHLRKKTVVELVDPKKADTSTAALAPVSSLSTAASDTTANARAATTTTFGLRSALVQLGGTTYWGSDADHPATATTDGISSNVVPAGRSAGATAASTGAAVVAAAQGPIVPLGRASGSRASRILEGSMDAVTMQ